jgi:hypothetical protein
MPTVPVVPVVEPDVHEVGDLADVPGEPAIETPPEPEAAEIDPVNKAARKRAGAPRKKAAPTVTVVDAPVDAGDMATTPASWVAPEAGGLVCPTSHPVKGKLSSKLFHLPGMFAYDRTKPDRCYRDEEAAVADGLRRAKR